MSKKTIQKFLKEETNYDNGQLYKVVPEVLLSNFYNWLKKGNEKINLDIQCDDCVVEYKDKRVKTNYSSYE